MTFKEAIDSARAKKVAIGHFNVSNLEAVHAIKEAVIETGFPAIIGVSDKEEEFFGIDEIVALVKMYQSKGFLLHLKNRSNIITLYLHLFCIAKKVINNIIRLILSILN